ncbi:MAG: alpha-L-fucosidase, partial [Phycisphaeraceae bacterium]|nr:alpha-L-fucosidase [Phycisphaeraceae bacterium]
ETPQWFTDAKFGGFICWGLYSVPAWSPPGQYSEWYQYWLQEKSFKGQVHDFHVKTYGEDFAFKDFAPQFKAELWDPNAWADLLKKAGAKYMIFTTKHHSGYTMWPSAEAEKTYGTNYNPVKVGPKRDITGELCAAVRKKDIKAGLYYSLYEWYHPLWKTDRDRFVSEHLFPQFKDLVTRYQPDVIWSDGEWSMPWENWRSPELLAWLFNNASNEKDLVINDRWGKGVRHKHGSFYTTEYGSGMDDDAHPWEENRGMGHSYGYNRAENLADYRTAQELILMLVDVVSRGGNLCLDIGPRADGTIPVVMQERLLQIGDWLKHNGEAIYGTRMWETPCQWSDGKVPALKRGEYMSKFNILEQTIAPPAGQARKEILFTNKQDNVYAITPKWPGETLVVKNIRPSRTTEVTLLETGQILPWHRKGDHLEITLPEFNGDQIKSRTAHAFRISHVTRPQVAAIPQAVKEMEQWWKTGKTLPMGITDTYPLREINIKTDTGINVLIDMAHKCDFFTLWHLGGALNQRGIRTIGSHATIDSVLTPGNPCRVRIPVAPKVFPFAWWPAPKFNVVLTEGATHYPSYLPEEQKALNGFIRGGGGLIVAGSNVKDKQAEQSWSLNTLLEAYDARILAGQETYQGQKWPRLQVSKDWEVVLKGENGYPIYAQRKVGKGRIALVASSALYRFDRKTRADVDQKCGFLKEMIQWAAAGSPPVGGTTQFPRAMGGGGGIYPESEVRIDGIVCFYSKNQIPELMGTLKQDFPAITEDIYAWLPSPKPTQPMYMILCSGSGGGWAVNAYLPKEASTISTSSNGIRSIFGHEQAHTMAGPCTAASHPFGGNRGEEHAG